MTDSKDLKLKERHFSTPSERYLLDNPPRSIRDQTLANTSSLRSPTTAPILDDSSLPTSPAQGELDKMGIRLKKVGKLREPQKDSMVWDGHGSPLGTSRTVKRVSPWIILPNSRIRIVWDGTIIVLMVYTIVYLPFKIGFGTSAKFDTIELIVDCLFIVDIVISFFLAYETPEGTIVTDQTKIIKKYLTSWFLVDLIAAFPFSLLGYADLDRYTEGLKAVKLLRIIKLLRLYRLKAWYHWLQHHPRMHRPTLKLTWFMLTLFSFSYLSGCLWHFMGELEAGNEDSWINRAFDKGIQGRTTGYKVLVSMYWSLTTLTTIGYGDISAETVPEIIFSLFIMLCGASLYSFITASAIHVLKKTDATEENLKKDVAVLTKFGKDMEIQQELLSKCLSNLRKRHFARKKTAASVWPVLEKLNPDLQKEVCVVVNRDLLDDCPFLIQFRKHPQFLKELLVIARPGMAYPGEFIINQGDPCGYFYIMRSGAVSMVFSQHRELKLKHLESNEVFGHEIILITGVALCNFMCVVETHFVRIETHAFLQMLSRYNDRFEDISRLAEERVQSITREVKALRKKIKADKDSKIMRPPADEDLRQELKLINKHSSTRDAFGAISRHNDLRASFLATRENFRAPMEAKASEVKCKVVTSISNL